MHFSMQEMWAIMAFPVKICVMSLILMSVSTFVVMFERFFFYRKVRSQSNRFMKNYAENIRNQDYESLFRDAESYSDGHLPKAVYATMREFEEYDDDGGDDNKRKKSRGTHLQILPSSERFSPELAEQLFMERIEAGHRSLERVVSAQQILLKSWMALLGTVAGSAPFVGLVGTVIGVINAFGAIAESGSGGLGAVSAGLSEALVTTAFGIGVAIFPLWGFNYFTARMEVFVSEMTSIGTETLDFLIKEKETLAYGSSSRK